MVVQGENEDELPESIIAVSTLKKVDLSLAIELD
jgi:hypothetical protein